MSFLNWMLLGGTLAFAAPLLIHLLNRSRFKVVDWGAMHLLDAALQVNSKRIEWQSWLLLFMRCMIPILLALALARPVFTKWRSASAAGDKSLVLLIDNSLSMQAQVGEGSTRFDKAIAQATELIKRQKPSTELSLWTVGGVPTDVLNGNSFDHALVLNKLSTLHSGASSVPVQSAFSAAIKRISGMQNANREIVLISDFQNDEWLSFNEAEQSALRDQLTAESLPIQLTLLPIRDVISATNLSVEIDAFESPLVVVDQAFRISVQVRNHGANPANDIPVILKVAGTEIASRRVSIPGNGVEQAMFDCQIQAAGNHQIEVRIDDAAGYEADNVANQIVVVRQPLQVLIVDERAAASELQRASGYLSLALSPFVATDSGKNLVQSRVVAPDRVVRGEVAEHDVVVLADVSRLNDKLADEVADFVEAGGGLLLFSGSAIDPNWYNNRWGGKSKRPLLPSQFLKQPRPITGPSRIDIAPLKHPALSSLVRESESGFEGVEFQRWREFEIEPQAESNNSVDVLLRLENGHPLLLTKASGNGHVMQFASSVDTGDSNLPLRPVFVPLMQGLVQWLATGSEQSFNVVAGQPLTIRPDTSANDLIYVVTIPDASKMELRIDGGSQVAFTQTALPGVYSVADPRANAAPMQFAISAPVAESRLQFLTMDQIQETANSIGASVASDSVELATMQSQRANGREVWRWMLLGMIAMLFAELWWQQRIARGSL